MERTSFKKLSVFRGGFVREAAERVTDVPFMTLTVLVDKSLLRYRQEGRYNVHELLRQYAAEKLAEIPDEHQETLDQYSNYYAVFLDQRIDDLKGARQKEALDEIAAEIDNVRASWRWAVDSGQYTLIGRCLDSLWFFYEIRGWYQEGEGVFREAIQRLSEQTGKFNQPQPEVDLILAQLMARRGACYAGWGLHREGEKLLHQSLGMFRCFGQSAQWDTAFARLALGGVDNIRGDYPEAKKQYQKCHTEFSVCNDQWGIGVALLQLGVVAELMGGYEEAKQFYRKSITILTELGERRWRAAVLSHLGNVATEQGQFAQAEQLFREAFQMCQTLGDHLGMA